MIVDPLKGALISEMSNAEWEMLEQDEWDDGGEQLRADEAERRSEDRRVGTDGRGEHVDADADAAAAVSARVKGTSGWTKVKNREK